MTDQSIGLPNFSLTVPAPCPYLPDRRERKIFTQLIGENAQSLNDALTQVGFRRSQNVVYKPACDGCDACVSVRIPVDGFRPVRWMRRILRTNADLDVRASGLASTDEQFHLLRRYLKSRHPDGGMAEMDLYDFMEMVEASPVDTFIVEYRMPSTGEQPRYGDLVGACLTDMMSDGLSMVYSFYDPDQDRRSLGSYIILSHVELARRLRLPYVYLGYWIAGCRKMDYKARFRPLEMLTDDGWEPFPER